MRTTSARYRYQVFTALAAALIAAPAGAQTIGTLNVSTATSKRVDLSWTGTGASYNVQRRVLGSTYSTVATVTNSTYSDTQIDAYTTYEYQVTASASAVSNSVRVGPPPAGLTAV